MERKTPFQCGERDPYKGCGLSHAYLYYKLFQTLGFVMQGAELNGEKFLVGAEG